MDSAEIEAHVNQYLSNELEEMAKAGFSTAYPKLSPCEKALIYYYTCDEGYKELNRQLHLSGGNNTSPLGQGLVVALSKLPAFTRLVRSAVHLTDQQLIDYQQGSIFIWPAFLSTTTSHKVAKEFLKHGAPGREKNAMFLIKSLSGRRIGQLSYYGPNGPGKMNSESEVLFPLGAKFTITKRTNHNTETGVIEFELEELEPVI